MKYQAYSNHNYKKIAQISKLSENHIKEIDIVGSVLPFKTNNYVVEKLIDWDNFETDPIFILNFPQKGMLQKKHFDAVKSGIDSEMEKSEFRKMVNDIRLELNPHPAGQESNLPVLNGEKLQGVQHKYSETVLFFPSQGQTCHAYCTFCFRWPQFVGMDDLKFAMRQGDLLVDYFKSKPEATDILFTGGDPMIMNSKLLNQYIGQLIDADIEHLRTIRIGTKSLAFWPYRFLTDPDSDDVIRLFEKVVKAGKNLALMAHFNHVNELQTPELEKAVRRLLDVGVQIRTQSPLLQNINADSDIWSKMWKKQVSLGMIPYYMFVARDTGAQQYFAVPLINAWKIFKEAYSQLSGIHRTVRGPSMSANPGKVLYLGPAEVRGEKVMIFTFIQGRDANWVKQPFFAKYNPNAIWLDDLEPAFGEEKFFFE